MRSLVGTFFVVLALSGQRVGELMQLRWGDLEWRGVDTKRFDAVNLMLINVRAETSKVRKSRRLYCRDEGYVRAWANIIANVWKQPSIRDRLVFSLDGYKPFSKRALHYHFDKLMELAGIDRTDRGLVPYSFRHYFITERITAGLSYHQVAEMCGTSVAQIEKTYFHLNDQVRMAHALTGYEIDEDGLVVPVAGQ